MSGCRVSYVFFFFAFAITVGAQQTGQVSISDTKVTLTCPFDDTNEKKVTWTGPKEGYSPGKILTIDAYDNKHDGLYSCSINTDGKHYFYVKAKVCEGCVDLDMSVAILVVFGDVLITALIVITVYFCARKKAETAAPQRATQARQARGQARGPTPPDPDYQPLNPATRSNDVYAHPQRR